MGACGKNPEKSGRKPLGFLGGYYSGMLDMYSDFTLLQSKTGIHIEILEMCDIAKALENITDAETAEMLEKINAFFEISGDSPSDPIARRPEEAQLRWSAEGRLRAAAADGAVSPGCPLLLLSRARRRLYEEIQSGFIVGNSLLTAEGIPCAGEGDIKTNLAMKISDIIGCGGSFSEIVAADFNRNTMIIGHDGPFHRRDRPKEADSARNGRLSRKKGQRRFRRSKGSNRAGYDARRGADQDRIKIYYQ